MKPPVFDYHDPETVAETLDLLARYGEDGKVLAGGQSLMPLLNFRLATPANLIDVNRVRDLAGSSATKDTLTLGALTRQRALERSEQVRAWAPLLSQAVPYIGHPQIRNRGTLGGSLAHADPAAELPAVALALDARLVLRSKGGERVVEADDFFVTQLTTVMRPDELLVAVELPAWPVRTGSGIQEIAMRHGDFALAGAATVLAMGADGRIEKARVVCFGVDDRPVRIKSAEAALVGTEPGEAAFKAAAAEVVQAIDPPADIHASAAYRRRVAGVLTQRALAQAATPAGELVA